MKSLLAPAALVLAAAAAALAAVSVAESRRLREELDGYAERPPAALETRLVAAEARALEASRAAARQEELLRTLVPSLEDGAMARFEGGASGAPGEPGSTDGGSDGGGGPGSPGEGGRFRTLVREAVREELEARKAAAGEENPGPPKDPKKPPLSQVAALLDLSDAQKASVQQAVQDGQREVIEMLRTPAGSGRIPLHDLVDAFVVEPENARARVAEVIGVLMVEKVPGGDRTYAEEWGEIRRRTNDLFRLSFTPEQYRDYEKMGQDPLEIQVEGSPWVEVVQEAFRRRGK